MLAKLQEDLKSAMKASDKLRVSTIRMMVAEGQKEQINNQKDLTLEQWQVILKRGIKTREESLEHFRKNNRNDLVEKEEAEIEVLKAYLPQQLTGEALEKLVDEVIGVLKVSQKKDMGLVMKTVMSSHGNQVDGKEVQRIVLQKLS
ncbi:MAG: GatB/YqeY domain-containing protein [Chlamydiota bacterium]|nr:GatB/YqeY domain-containing protein [Chlamydiota bacterium]